MSRGIVRTGYDVAGGTIQPAQTRVRIGINPVGTVGSPVDSHAPCPLVFKHCDAHMAQGNPKIRIGDIPVCFERHEADCGHGASGRQKIRMG